VRILFCNKYNFLFSGTEVYLFELMNLLRSQGHEVALFSMLDSRGKPTPYDQYFVPHIDFKKPNGISAQARLLAHAIYSSDARKRLGQMIAAFRPDLAHVRNIYHHLSPSILWELKRQGIPVLFHLNDFKLLCPAYNMVAHGRACLRPCTGRFWKVLSQGCYDGPAIRSLALMTEAYAQHWAGTYRKCIDHFLVPSGFARRMLLENGFDPEKISVLPHFQHLPGSVPPLDVNGPVLYFGRLSAEKGVPDLVRAMKTVPDIQLQIAGDGPQRPELEELVRKLRLDNVAFLGALDRPQLESAIARSRFTVFPSRAYETLGKCVLESYALGRAVIASDLGSRREIVRENETGLLYRAGDVDQLAGAISFLAQRRDLATEMGLAGRKFVETCHSPAKHYEDLTFLYRRLVATGAARRNRIRVAFIGGRGVISKYSGVESYYEEVGKLLAEMGHEVTVYCRTYFTPKVNHYNGMRLVRLPTFRSKHLETVLHSFLSTIHVMIRGCDIVHYHALGPALFSFLPRLLGQKTVVTVQGLDWQRKKWGRLASLTLKAGEIASARFPDATMVVSRTLQNYYQQHYGVQTNYVPNGAVLRNRTAFSDLWEWRLSPGYILFLGRFSPEKNCHLLIDAYEKTSLPLKLVLAGGSSHTSAYVAGLRKHASDRIVFLDWVSGNKLTQLLTNADLLVLPSDMEGLSLALLDAMAAGVCVLTSDIPENREVVEDVGFTFRRGDVEDLSRMMTLLAAEPDLRQASARKGKEVVLERYFWPNIARDIAQIYAGLLGRPSAENIPIDAAFGTDYEPLSATEQDAHTRG
jgi:glycosyltransferase involved in cell wall biosynthesis